MLDSEACECKGSCGPAARVGAVSVQESKTLFGLDHVADGAVRGAAVIAGALVAGSRLFARLVGVVGSRFFATLVDVVSAGARDRRSVLGTLRTVPRSVVAVEPPGTLRIVLPAF